MQKYVNFQDGGKNQLRGTTKSVFNINKKNDHTKTGMSFDSHNGYG